VKILEEEMNMSENSTDSNSGAEATGLATAAKTIGAGAGTAAGTATNLALAAQEYGERLSDKATNLAQTAQEYGGRLSDKAGQAKEYVAGKASVVGDKFKELQNADLGELTDTARQFARKNPGQAILISAAAGLLLGLLLRGGRR
jgi:ElaB/YqjD/DUF883 family membrane-anchored ribosome-binding protein